MTELGDIYNLLIRTRLIFPERRRAGQPVQTCQPALQAVAGAPGIWLSSWMTF